LPAPLKVDELDWMTSFKYECLKSQITIRGVYIKGYAAGGWEDYDLPEGAGFCVAIQDWLEARSQVVLAGEAQSPNGSCKLFAQQYADGRLLCLQGLVFSPVPNPVPNPVPRSVSEEVHDSTQLCPLSFDTQMMIMFMTLTTTWLIVNQ
jgi:hypothetical protein